METSFVLWAGHFTIGAAYYLRNYLLLTKEEKASIIEKAIKEDPSRKDALPIVNNKLLTFVFYLLAGYVNIFFSVQKICEKVSKKK